jgi:tetratricopeptide (TPR) repeat protein
MESTRAVLDAAPLAIENGAPAEAEVALRAAIASHHDTKTTAGLQFTLAQALSAQGRYGESLGLLRAMDPDYLLEPRRAAVASLLRAKALQGGRLADDRTIREAAEQALALTEAAGADRLQAAAAQVMAEAASEMGLASALVAVVEGARRMTITSSSTATRAQALLTTGFCLMTTGQYEDALTAFRESEGLLDGSSMEAELARSLNGRAISLVGLGRHPEALVPLNRALQIAAKHNDAPYRATLTSNLGVIFEEMGMFDEADVHYREAIVQAPKSSPRSAAIAHMNTAHIALIRDDFDRALASLGTARELVRQSQSWRLSSLVDLAQADILLALGEPERAWPIANDALNAILGRGRSIDTNGRTVRLALHSALATSGTERFAELVDRLSRDSLPLRAADRHEVSGFLRWAVPDEAARRSMLRSDVFDCELGALPGAIAALAAVGTAPHPWTRQPGETAAEMIERFFKGRGLRPHLLPHSSQLARPPAERIRLTLG